MARKSGGKWETFPSFATSQHSHSHTHTHSGAQSHRASPLRRTPLPLSLSRPCQFLSQCVYLKYADEAFVVPCPSLDAHSFGLRSIMAWARGGSSAHHAYTHTKTHAQHSWGHSLSTSGARLLPLQPDKSPRDTQKKRQGPSVRGARVQAARPISALLQATPASCYYPTPTGFGQRGGKKMRGRKVGRRKKKGRPKKRDGKRERDGWKKETFRFFHLLDFDKWPGL